ncbi:MAG: porin family protein [Bradyrhizobium sp.]|nr:porin family protein [Bradyrhizobium sp.]
MKKVLLTLTAAVAFSGSAFAADMAPRTYTKAPAPMVVAPSWTGFYLFGGGGGGVWDADTGVQSTTTGAPLLGFNQRQGGNGWFGTVGGGYDWQFGGNWVAGIFGDAQFGSLKGTVQDQDPFFAGNIKNDESWAAGARLGYLVAPNVLSYVNGGYSGSHWKGAELFDTRFSTPSGFHVDGFDRSGWFIGGGVENNLNIFGITAPGWFMKTEYRAAYYENKNLGEFLTGTNTLGANTIGFKPLVQSVSTSLVYRFNWSGPVVAKY